MKTKIEFLRQLSLYFPWQLPFHQMEKEISPSIFADLHTFSQEEQAEFWQRLDVILSSHTEMQATRCVDVVLYVASCANETPNEMKLEYAKNPQVAQLLFKYLGFLVSGNVYFSVYHWLLLIYLGYEHSEYVEQCQNMLKKIGSSKVYFETPLRGRQLLEEHKALWENNDFLEPIVLQLQF